MKRGFLYEHYWLTRFWIANTHYYILLGSKNDLRHLVNMSSKPIIWDLIIKFPKFVYQNLCGKCDQMVKMHLSLYYNIFSSFGLQLNLFKSV